MVVECIACVKQFSSFVRQNLYIGNSEIEFPTFPTIKGPMDDTTLFIAYVVTSTSVHAANFNTFVPESVRGLSGGVRAPTEMQCISLVDSL